MAEIEKMLDDVIELKIENLGSITDAEGLTKAIQALAQLHMLRIEEIKAKTEAEEKRRQKKDIKIDRVVKIIVSGAELIVPLVFYGIWYGKGLKFEETGSYTATTFKSMVNRIKPTK